MELLELIKHRRSIRKYQDKQISRTDLEKSLKREPMRQMQEAASGASLSAFAIRSLLRRSGG